MTKWKGKSRGGAFGYLFFIFLIKKFGLKAAYAFLSLVVIYFIPFAPNATKNIWFYSRHILKLKRWSSMKMLVRNYYRLGQTLIDKVAIGYKMKDKYNFCFENYNEFLDILNSNQGTIIIGAHIGNWEIGSTFFDEYGKKINIILYDAEYHKIKEIMKNNTAYADYKIIPISNNCLDYIFAIKEAIDNKEYVCFQGDRYFNEDRLLKATFMGKDAYFPIGPFLLASKMKVPVVFYFSMREKRRTYRFHFTIATPITEEKGKRSEQNILEQYIIILENILQRYPEQWFNYYNFWDNKKNQFN